MRTYKVVTSQHKPYYDKIGRDCIASFLEYWPKEFKIELWAEDFVPDIKDKRLIVKDFNKTQPRLQNFLELIKPHVPNSPPKNIYAKFRPFWLKGHVTLSALEEFDSDVFIWLDSDVTTHKHLTVDFFDKLLPEDTLSVDIPAGGKVRGKEAETGFLMLNMKHPMKDIVINHYKEAHTTLKILEASRRLETGVWWDAVHLAESKGAKIKHLATAVDSIIPFMSTELAEYLRHWVTKGNKKHYAIGNKEKTLEEN